MRRLLTRSALVVFAAAVLYGQTEDKEGKAWLDGCAEASTLNVTGLWKSTSWGMISLNQHKDSRNIVGSGDGWDFTGVVSGNSVCLVISHHSKVAYTAKLTAEGAGQLSGVYAKGLLSASSRTSPMQLTK